MSDRQSDLSPSHIHKRLPVQRWQIATPQPEQAQALSMATGLSPLVAQVIANRDITTADEAHTYIEPESQDLPSPLEEFADLTASVELIQNANRR